MPIARITGQGISAMALCVAALWGCLIAERVVRQRAFTYQSRELQKIELLQRRFRPQPVSAPLPVFPRRVRPTAS